MRTHYVSFDLDIIIIILSILALLAVSIANTFAVKVVLKQIFDTQANFKTIFYAVFKTLLFAVMFFFACHSVQEFVEPISYMLSSVFGYISCIFNIAIASVICGQCVKDRWDIPFGFWKGFGILTTSSALLVLVTSIFYIPIMVVSVLL